ncbi:hypothetical protein D9M70_632190 [compost metagenome]
MQTINAGPSSGTCFSMPCRRSRYSARTSSQLRNRIRNSGTIVKIQIATSALAMASARKI